MIKTQKLRSKPVIIEAVQLTEENKKEIQGLYGERLHGRLNLSSDNGLNIVCSGGHLWYVENNGWIIFSFGKPINTCSNNYIQENYDLEGEVE